MSSFSESTPCSHRRFSILQERKDEKEILEKSKAGRRESECENSSGSGVLVA